MLPGCPRGSPGTPASGELIALCMTHRRAITDAERARLVAGDPAAPAEIAARIAATEADDAQAADEQRRRARRTRRRRQGGRAEKRLEVARAAEWRARRREAE